MIWCYGSINIDLFYEVPHIPAPGETLSALAMRRGLGGKGANQSVAAAKAGSQVCHIGAVGPDGEWCLTDLSNMGVICRDVARLENPTGHAIIALAQDGENAIILMAGANKAQSIDHIKASLMRAKEGDILLLQNEVSDVAKVAEFAKSKGLYVIYSAAPFDVAACDAVRPFVDLIAVNEGEAKALTRAFGSDPAPHMIVTLGDKGAEYRDTPTQTTDRVAAIQVTPIDTTGAGDTFIGYFAAGLDQGLIPKQALTLANQAAALKVTRKGTADAIPSRQQVDGFI